MPEPPAIHTQLLSAISEPRVRARVGFIIDLCIGAVEGLDTIDQSVYERAQESDAPTRKALEKLADTVLDGVRSLERYLKNCDFAADAQSDDDGGDMDFDFDLGGGGDPEPSGNMTLSDDDIAGALDGLLPELGGPTQDRWTKLSGELTSLSYAFTTQLKDFDQRFRSALDGERLVQAQRELDDVGDSLIDGVFALMSTICDTYLDKYDRDSLLPGHRDTLGKALLVRRGLAVLRRAVNRSNSVVQDAAAEDDVRQEALDAIGEQLADFLDGEVFAAMRPADRLELKSFHGDIAGATVKRAALSCEGLDKYLDSLVSVNQRDVLIKHDRELMNEVAELLEGVAPLLDISPHGAIDMLRQAFERAVELRGYRDAIDNLVLEWELSGMFSTDPKEILDYHKRLAALVGPAN